MQVLWSEQSTEPALPEACGEWGRKTRQSLSLREGVSLAQDSLGKLEKGYSIGMGKEAETTMSEPASNLPSSGVIKSVTDLISAFRHWIDCFPVLLAISPSFPFLLSCCSNNRWWSHYRCYCLSTRSRFRYYRIGCTVHESDSRYINFIYIYDMKLETNPTH